MPPTDQEIVLRPNPSPNAVEPSKSPPRCPSPLSSAYSSPKLPPPRARFPLRSQPTLCERLRAAAPRRLVCFRFADVIGRAVSARVPPSLTGLSRRRQVLPMMEGGLEFSSSLFEAVCGWPCTLDSIGVATIDSPENGMSYTDPYNVLEPLPSGKHRSTLTVHPVAITVHPVSLSIHHVALSVHKVTPPKTGCRTPTPTTSW
eukprot:1195360-Prorocentrum_minimum.AAC.6